jgi:hypothetical protein
MSLSAQQRPSSISDDDTRGSALWIGRLRLTGYKDVEIPRRIR